MAALAALSPCCSSSFACLSFLSILLAARCPIFSYCTYIVYYHGPFPALGAQVPLYMSPARLPQWGLRLRCSALPDIAWPGVVCSCTGPCGLGLNALLSLCEKHVTHCVLTGLWARNQSAAQLLDWWDTISVKSELTEGVMPYSPQCALLVGVPGTA